MPGTVAKWLALLGVCAVLWAVLWPAAARTQDETIWQDNMAAAMSAHRREDYAAAERYLRSALVVAESFGPEDRRLADTLFGLSTVLYEQENYAAAQGPLERLVGMLEADAGQSGPLGPALVALAQVYTRLRDIEAADAIYIRALAATERARGPEHRNVAGVLNNLAGLRMAAGRYAEAEPLFARALAIREQTLGPNHPEVARTLESYAALLRLTGRTEEAEAMEARMGEILGN